MNPSLAALVMLFAAAPACAQDLVGPRLFPVGHTVVAAGAQPQAAPSAWTNSVDFTCVKASQDAKATAACLATSGITVTRVTEGSKVAIVDNRDVYEGGAAAPANGRMLMQIDKNGPVSYTLEFKPELLALVFTRAKLIAGPNGITHPKWSARALDAEGHEIAVVGEDLIGSRQDVPAKSFALRGPGIVSVRFDSDGRNFTAFSAVLIEKLEPRR